MIFTKYIYTCTNGFLQIVYNDELRKLSSRYLITQNEIKQMLERYAEGGTATITKVRANLAIGMIEKKQFKLYYFRNKSNSNQNTEVQNTLDQFTVYCKSLTVTTQAFEYKSDRH